MSSPSGAGKTTLSRKLLAADANIAMSVSVTTRKPRPGEVDGKDYHFISQAQFEDMVARASCWNGPTVFGNSYGTPQKARGRRACRQAAMCCSILTGKAPSNWRKPCRKIWCGCSSCRQRQMRLRQRLINRAQDSSSVIAKRMAEAAHEISHWPEYDYVIVNDDVETATSRSWPS